MVNEGVAEMENNCGKVERMLRWYIHALHGRYFQKFLRKSQGEALIKCATQVYKASVQKGRGTEERERTVSKTVVTLSLKLDRRGVLPRLP
jgi:hypothetical protein